jgi:hypothetical protein
MHQRIPTIEGCANPSRVQSVMEKNGEDNQKPGKIGQIVNSTPTIGLKYDKIRA